MSDQNSNLDWNHWRAFLATAEGGSLSAAARDLNLTQPTLSRQVAALEEETGVTLFERVGKRLRITEAGRELVPHARVMAEAAAHLALTASGQSQAIDGIVRITASDVFSAFLLPEVLERLRVVAPRLSVDLVATNDLADLLRREADIAVRNVRPEQPDLFARLLVETTAHLYASRVYLDRRGHPEVPEDFEAHDFVNFGNSDRMVEFLKAINIHITPDQFRVGSENGLVAWELVRRGFGIAPMSDRVAAHCPEIVRVLPDMEPIRFPIWLVTHREVQTSRKIRLVFDVLAEALSEPN